MMKIVQKHESKNKITKKATKIKLEVNNLVSQIKSPEVYFTNIAQDIEEGILGFENKVPRMDNPVKTY